DALCAPSRAVLEPALVGAAADAGADVRLGIAVTDLLWQGGRVAGVRITEPGRGSVAVTARLVVGADGARSGVADRVGAAPTWVGRHASAATCAQWSGLATDGFEWTFRPDACIGVVPVAADRTCVSVCASPGR